MRSGPQRAGYKPGGWNCNRPYRSRAAQTRGVSNDTGRTAAPESWLCEVDREAGAIAGAHTPRTFGLIAGAALGFSRLRGSVWNNLPVNLVPATAHAWFLVACAAGTVLTLLILIARVRLHPALALAFAALGLGVASGMPLKQVPLSFTAAWGICWAYRHDSRAGRDIGPFAGQLGRGHGAGPSAGRSLRRKRPALGAAGAGHPGRYAGIFRSGAGAAAADCGRGGAAEEAAADSGGNSADGRALDCARHAAAASGSHAGRDAISCRPGTHDSVWARCRTAGCRPGGAGSGLVSAAPLEEKAAMAVGRP